MGIRHVKAAALTCLIPINRVYEFEIIDFDSKCTGKTQCRYIYNCKCNSYS